MSVTRLGVLSKHLSVVGYNSPAILIRQLRRRDVNVAPSRRHAHTTPLDVKAVVAEGGITIFSKSFCPYCVSTKSLFKSMNVEFRVYEVNKMEEEREIMQQLYALTDQTSVPNVFINGVHLGGNSDAQLAAKDGSLAKMLAETFAKE
eukprot:m.115836 g.115836  ORF g.115836 m.115836 type:complete len:147 (-) comp28454_c0_seq1:193-633(-)